MKVARDFHRILPLIGKQAYYRTLAVLVAASLLEVGGVAIFYPYLEFLLNPARIHENPVSRAVYQRLSLSSNDQFLILFGVAAIVAIVVSGCIGAYSKVSMNRYIWNANVILTRWLYTRYIEKAYVELRRLNTDTIAKNVLNEVSIFTNGLLVPWSELVSRLIVVIVWTVLLTVVNPLATVIVMTLTAGIYLGLFGSLRRGLRRMSEQRFQMQEELFDYVNSSFRAIKDIKINESEQIFIDKIERPARHFSDLNHRMTLIAQLPRYVIESLLFSLAVVVLLFNVGSASIVTLIPVLSLYSMAALRLIPHVQNLFAAVARIRFNTKALDLIIEEMEAAPGIRSDAGVTAREAFVSLRAEDVSFRFADSTEDVFRQAHFEVAAGRTAAILGKSGSGKSTFVEVLLGLLRPLEGRVLCNDTALTPGMVLTSRVNVGYVSQDVVLFEGTLRENICLHRTWPNEAEELARAVENACLTDVVNAIGGVDAPVVEGGKNLSAGQRQRVALARALYRKPELLFLDEATSALDRSTELAVMGNISRLGIGVVMITHHAALTEFADVIYDITTPGEVRERPGGQAAAMSVRALQA